ncbi:hypothetical protein [Williamsia deligens]|uniref:DUF8176 domain-containing protein n=1 Tax=Williamsia deligens TaxID=321325 RepID=A0ABW3G5B2_9NOCA|nr:hypothetical protein [Williamsia deligens]MCP2193775.1 hypothetical protein [Williamsia deligens]
MSDDREPDQRGPDRVPDIPEEPAAPTSLPEPPWFAMRTPEPPRGSPEAPPLAGGEYRSPESWSAGLEQIATARRPQRRRRRLRPLLLAVAVLVVIGGIVAGIVALVGSSTSGGGTSATQARVEFCAPGTRGGVTTVSAAQEATTPVGAVATFLDAAIRTRSAPAARAVMSQAAPAPTVGQLQTWISSLPATTDGWCAQISTTESAARVLVDVRLRTANGVAEVARGTSFYVSTSDSGRWTIDAIVADSAVNEQRG